MEIARTEVPQTPLFDEKHVSLASTRETEEPMFSCTRQNEVTTGISLLQTSAKENLNNDEVISPARGKLYSPAYHFVTISLTDKHHISNR